MLFPTLVTKVDFTFQNRLIFLVILLELIFVSYKRRANSENRVLLGMVDMTSSRRTINKGFLLSSPNQLELPLR